MIAKMLLTAAVLAAGAAAQDPNAELERLRRSLGNSRAEVERLLDLRIRHDLGMAVVDEVLEPSGTAPATPEAMAKMQKEIAEQDAVNLTLQERFRRLSVEVDRLRQDAAAEAATGRGDARAIVEVPAVGAAVPRTAQAADLRGAPAPARASGGAVVDHGIGVTRPPADKVAATPAMRGPIEGSEDHLLVGQALFAAARRLVDQAAQLRDQGRVDDAKELDDRAKQLLESAVKELEPIVSAEKPPFQALFCQGRSLELLFRYSERYENLSIDRSPKEYQQREAAVRKPFLEISGRDVEPAVLGGSPKQGEWGLAAQTVLEHFRWINVHGGYRPRIEIDSLNWSGEHR
jgi:hypothetical protein